VHLDALLLQREIGALMILVLDNRDSFVWNLARYVQELGGESIVRSAAGTTIDEVLALAPSRIIISPGPCTPAESGISTAVVREFGATIPILGVCLGHQCIGEAYGGRVVRARFPLHGKRAPVIHDATGVLDGIPSPFMATRYHSLVIDSEGIPEELRVTAHSAEGEIMAVQHHVHPVHGVQFHPESAATEWGYRIIANFLGLADSVQVSSGADMGRTLLNESR
jgi:anthranilate synthase/aminodeoxychorismate synthase-like glutamine amidotransferase